MAHPHVWPAHRVYRSERAVFLVRQFMAANLAQRTTTRPFLTHIEKVGEGCGRREEGRRYRGVGP